MLDLCRDSWRCRSRPTSRVCLSVLTAEVYDCVVEQVRYRPNARGAKVKVRRL